MTPQAMIRWFTSARTTVTLLGLLAVLLLLNVVVPQAALVGEEVYASILEQGGPARVFLLETLGFGRMARSPVFLGVLGVFFLNLAAVLAVRLGPTWRRIALRPRAEDGLKAWARMEESLGAALPERFGVGTAARALRGFGYQSRKVGEHTLWAVKHRTAPLGFLLFHLSFFLLCAGGIWIYYTRFVGTVMLSEGQAFAGGYSQILRQPPVGEPASLRFVVERVETRQERGEPVHLEAQLRVRQAGSTVGRSSRVNHPARWGSASILVERAGLAPVLWLQDSRGFTLDRVVALARTRAQEATVVPMAEGRFDLVISPLGQEQEFPTRDQRATTAMTFELIGEEGSLVAGALRPGEAAGFSEGRLVFEELRYWVGLRIISERGGGLLIAGFTAGILGLIWRLLWYRREVVVTWDTQELRLVGRSEYFSDRFRRELAGILAALRQEAGAAATEGVPESP